MHAWLDIPFSSPHSQLTMTCYELNFTVPSPGFSTSFMEFSPNGRFLGVGDQGVPSLYILDKLAGFHPRISAITLREPTALVWETTETFYVGFINGYFAHYQINLKGEKLVEGVVNSSLHGEGFPITSMALDAQSRTLVMSVGPGVFAFHRIHATSEPRLLISRGGKLTPLKASSTSLHVSRPASISRKIRELQPRHFQGLCASLPTICLSSHSVGDIWREVHDRTYKTQPHLLSSAPLS